MHLPNLKEKTILIPSNTSLCYEKTLPYSSTNIFNISFKTSLGICMYFFQDSFLFFPETEKKFALVQEKKKLQNSISEIQAHLKGVEEGICICLELVSKTYYVEVTCYKESREGYKINLYLGKSHPIVIYLPSHIKVKHGSTGFPTTTKSTQLLLYGVSKQEITYFASWIKNLRPANCFTGRGIRYKNEKIFLKQKKR